MVPSIIELPVDAPIWSCALPTPSGGVPGPVTMVPETFAPDAVKSQFCIELGLTTTVELVELNDEELDDELTEEDDTEEPVPEDELLESEELPPEEELLDTEEPLPEEELLESEEPLPDDELLDSDDPEPDDVLDELELQGPLAVTTESLESTGVLLLVVTVALLVIVVQSDVFT